MFQLRIRKLMLCLVHKILVLITCASSEGSVEPAYPCSLARAVTAHTHNVYIVTLIKIQVKI